MGTNPSKSIWSLLLRYRNEPVFAILSVAIVILTAVASTLIINQSFVRNEALVCGGQWLPIKGSCDPEGYVPVGTVIAFFGLDNRIPDGWRVCNGQTISDNSAWDIDADPKRPGIQLPDLRHRFIRGSQDELDSSHLALGGRNGVELRHSHQWARVNNHKWYTYSRYNHEFRVDDWNDGVGEGGTGEFPLKADDVRGRGNMSMHTDRNVVRTSTLPRYAELRYIIKVR